LANALAVDAASFFLVNQTAQIQGKRSSSIKRPK